MQRCSIATLSALGALCVAPFAQGASLGHALSAGVDLGVRSARDDLIVPLTASGPSLGFGARFLGGAGPGLLDTGIRFEVAALFDRYVHPAAGVFYAMRLGYLPVLCRSPSGWSLLLGPVLIWETDALWLAKWDDAHAYWMGRRYLALSTRAQRRLSNSWRLDLSGEINTLGFEARPPAYRYLNTDPLTHPDFYLAGMNARASFGSVFDWQAVRLEADVSHTPARLGRASGNSFGVETRFSHTAEPEHSFVFELNLRFAYVWDLR